MTPMDEQDFDQMKAAVAEGTVEGQRLADEERTGEHRLPSPASKVGKAFWGIVTSLFIMAIGGGIAYVRWAGAKDVTDSTQALELERHDKVLIRLDADKANKVDVQRQIDTWTAAQTKVLEEVKSANTQQHQDINGKLDKLLWEMRKGGGR